MGTIGGIARATIGVISGLGRRLLAEHRQIEPFGDASPSRVPKRFVSQQTRRSEAGLPSLTRTTRPPLTSDGHWRYHSMKSDISDLSEQY